ncbi:hypothetical protein SAMD00019534_040330 [Acytostelium subglobosum LB1]|uniref:hypothetical protein n=1 Tax=Acytostelium subglobosum LB1 TaxID=1410327 RepID=UPI000644D840|nr:hypothetical protein SAMD00019534_040330 [Acytostelium subglobosum LB1]GAM20858.1 hypothetical protein SAMD00019534_040330 [Acytostelium subglobosum LB1]|eukprot:XP_012755992.1 hypothetical protein SAMD00019534_040330 [Acytostelium subglobosum LB1]
MLHEDFNCLFVLPRLWQPALAHSVKCNMLDSVQYIIDNLPALDLDKWGYRMFLHNTEGPNSLNTLFTQCAKDGNIAIFQELAKSSVGAEYLKTMPMRYVISEAIDHGHEAFLKHLYQHHVGNGTIMKTWEDIIPNCFIKPEFKLRVTPLAALRSGDTVCVEKLIHSIDGLDSETCCRISNSMATFIVSPRILPFTFHYYNNTLLNLIKAVGQPGSNITLDMVCQFVVNCRPIDPEENVNEAMRCAAGHSAELMRLLRSHYNAKLDNRCLAQSMEKGCRETMVSFSNN